MSELFENQGSFSLICKAGAIGRLTDVDLFASAAGRNDPHSLMVVSSGGHSDNDRTVVEEILNPCSGLSGSHDYRVRGGYRLLHRAEERQVFSTGSIAFSRSLPHNNFDNSVSRLLANVVSAFIKR